MSTLKEAAATFLARERIAVAGVSRDTKQPANLIFRTLRRQGHQVFAVNPNADHVEGETCYHDLHAIPGGFDALMVATPAAASLGVVREAAELGVQHVWLHRSFGPGSTSDEAVAYAHERGMEVIAGGCPMMFVPGADAGHRCMKFILSLTGGLPKTVGEP